MSTIILFEDQSLTRLRPLTWSVPAYEVRCGMFTARERLELVAPGGGHCLARPVLQDLHAAPGWSPDPETAMKAVGASRTLWVNGRVAPDFDLLAALYRQRDTDWAIRDESGLLAASLSAELGSGLLTSWCKWSEEGMRDNDWAHPWALPAAVDRLPAPALAGAGGKQELGWIWDLVPATQAAIGGDLKRLGSGQGYCRYPFGIFPADEAIWRQEAHLRRWSEDEVPAGVHVTGRGGVWLGSGGVDLAAGTHLDTSGGPIVLDGGVSVLPNSYLAGPLYLGRGCIVKPGARIFGESSFGVGCRLAGEIGESTAGDFVNKQHDGFIGHAVLGSWINLGALTTCSDLKNNYGPVRVDQGSGERDTGRRFVGLLAADQVKTAIGTLFNTGTVVGFAANIFGGGMPPKHVPGFSWGGQAGQARYDAARACQTAAVVMERRGCRWLPAHDALFRRVFEETAG